MTDKQKRRGVTVWEIPRKAEFMHALRKGAEEMHWPVSHFLSLTFILFFVFFAFVRR